MLCHLAKVRVDYPGHGLIGRAGEKEGKEENEDFDTRLSNERMTSGPRAILTIL